MPKFISDLHLDQFFSASSPLAAPSKKLVSSVAFPLSIVSGLLLLDAALNASVTSAAIGTLGLIAAQAIKVQNQSPDQ